MLFKKSLFMKASLSLALVFAIAVTSCAQKQKDADRRPAVKAIAVANEPPAKTPQPLLNRVKMSVTGMVCNACQSNVKKTIKALPGVTNVEVNLENKYALFTYDPLLIQADQIQKAIQDKGFKAGIPQDFKQ